MAAQLAFVDTGFCEAHLVASEVKKSIDRICEGGWSPISATTSISVYRENGSLMVMWCSTVIIHK